MDINFKLEDISFNYRVAALIYNEDRTKLLVEKRNLGYYSLIGGRVKFKETSIEALIREIKEETNLTGEYVRSRGLIENFYISRYTNKLCHEILIIHEIKLDCDEDKIINVEDNEGMFMWVEINELSKENLVPKIVLDKLEAKEFFHIISDYRKEL